MSNQQPYDPDVSGSVWEQSQPTGNVWDQQAMDAWGTPQPQQAPAAPPPPPPAPNPFGLFFGSLFDFKFSTLLTLRAIKVVYLVLTIALGAWLLFEVVVGFTLGSGIGLIRLLQALVVFLAALAAIRVALEVALAVVRSSEDIRSQLQR